MVHIPIITTITIPLCPNIPSGWDSSVGYGMKHVSALSILLSNYCFFLAPPLTVVENAVFHCTLCMMEASSDFFLERRQPSQSSLRHVSQAIQLANRRLSGEKALSNKTLYVVLALTLYEQLRGDYQRWNIHLHGLYQLIDLRGGLANVIQCDGIVEKTCRLDITFALSTGCATHFRLSDIPFITRHTTYHDYGSTTNDTSILKSFSRIDPALLNVFNDVMALADKVNSSHLQKLDSHTFTVSLITLHYRLIEISSLENCGFTNAIDEGMHLGLTSFMLTLTLQLGRRRLLNQDFLSRRLKGFFQSKITAVVGEKYLLLWLLFISHDSVFNECDGLWLHPLIAREVEKLGIVDWKDLHTPLYQYPWVYSLHDESAQRILDQVLRARSEEISSTTVDVTTPCTVESQDPIWFCYIINARHDFSPMSFHLYLSYDSSATLTHPCSISSSLLAMSFQISFCIRCPWSFVTHEGTLGQFVSSSSNLHFTTITTYSWTLHVSKYFPWLSSSAHTACKSVRLPISAVLPINSHIIRMAMRKDSGAFRLRLVRHNPGLR